MSYRAVFALGFAVLGCGAAGPDSDTEGSGGTTTGTGGTLSSGGSSGGASGGTSSTGGGGAGGASNNGGTSNAGGTSGNGGSAGNGGGAGSDGPIPHMPGECNDLEDVGVWTNVTPEALPVAEDNYASSRFVVNPQNSAVLYLGTNRLGIHRSTDCGASWVKVNTGKNAAALDHGMQWTMAIDRVNPEVLYTNTGYGDEGSVAWKSTNGGVDWEKLIPDHYAGALQNSFVHLLTLDPKNHEHLIVTPHFSCQPGAVDGLPATTQCLLETTDAGATWEILEGTPGSGEGGGQWMHDADVWFWSSYFGGLARTTNGGGSWDPVIPNGNYADTDGVSPDDGATWYTGAEFNILKSTDAGETWNVVDGSPGTNFLASDVTHLFAVRGGSFHSADPGDPTVWTELSTPDFPFSGNIMSWELKYDPDHHLLYSLHASNGFWRMRAE